MPRFYGVRCDRCKVTLETGSSHYRPIGWLDVNLSFDEDNHISFILCPDCKIMLKELIGVQF